MKICSNCKTQNNDSANYCRQCGFVFPDINLKTGNVDNSLIDKINELQKRVGNAEMESANAQKKIATLNSSVSTLTKKLKQTEDSYYSAHQEAQKAQNEVQKAKKSLSEAESSKSNLHTLYIIALIIIGFIVALLIGDGQNKADEISELSSKNSELNIKVKNLNDKVSSLKSTNTALSGVLTKISGNTPLIVSSVDVRDASTSYGETIYSYNTTYLYPRITAYSLVDASQKIYVKLYTPYGLSTGNSSPSGFSFDCTIYPSKNRTEKFELTGWGNKEKGNWGVGNYRFEIWCKGKCIGTKSFTIY